MKLCEFAEVGINGKWYIDRVYRKRGYREVVDLVGEESMMAAVKEQPNYDSAGEWVITDARHDSTANAFHTTVPCLAGSNQKIVGISTLSRKEHSTAQTREFQCTKIVLPQVLARGLDVKEVAHDYQPQIRKFLETDLHCLNSFDTWHGTKNVTKEIKKVSVGMVAARGKTWFPELSDKRKSTKTHLYWCMKNANGDPVELRKNIMNISKHYQDIHIDCHDSSPCKKPGYSPSKIKLTTRSAIDAFEKALQRTQIYRSAESYCRCRDTYWVESFNHQLLIYLPKRIHFGTPTFLLHMNLALLDWNENVGRASTSECLYWDIRRPDRRTPMKVLVQKKYDFTKSVWARFIDRNKADVNPIQDEEDAEISDEDTCLEDGQYLEDEDDYYYEDDDSHDD